jgi:hypothetical protein
VRSTYFSRRLGVLALVLVAAASASGARGPGAAAQPDEALVVAITSPAPADVLRGRTLVRGWAVDVDHPPRLGNGINPRDVQLWLGPYPDGRRLDYARYGEPSEEAQQVFDARYAASGFVAEWETCSFSPGPYDLWTYVSSLASPGAQGYNTVAVTVAPCSPGSELYRGNFADRGAWPALTTASVETAPEADGWTIHQRVAGTSAQGPQGVFANFRASVTARIVGDDFDRYYYLQFRQAPGPNDTRSDGFYRLTIDPSFASFDLARWDGESETLLIPETRLPAVIRSPRQENQLAVLADGPLMRLFVNNTVVGEVVDDTYRWGRVSFGVGTNGQLEATAHFRDFLITAQ